LIIPQPFISPSLIALIINCIVPLLPGLLMVQPLDSKLLEGMGPHLTNLCVSCTLKSNTTFVPELTYGVEQLDERMSD
jgi:hypothetical protein